MKKIYWKLQRSYLKAKCPLLWSLPAIHGDHITSLHDYYVETATVGSVWYYYAQISSIFNKLVESYIFNALVTGKFYVLLVLYLKNI